MDRVYGREACYPEKAGVVSSTSGPRLTVPKRVIINGNGSPRRLGDGDMLDGPDWSFEPEQLKTDVSWLRFTMVVVFWKLRLHYT